MDPKILPFIKFSEDNTSKEAPEIRLEMKLFHASSELSITSPIRIDLVLRREQDHFDQSCVLVWNVYKTFARAQFVLLHQKGDVLEQVDVSHRNIRKELRDEDDVMKVNGYNHGLEQFRPGSSERSVQTLPENYHKMLVPGQRYRLIWPGEEIFMWDWGNKRDYVGKELESQAVRESKLPRLMLPACAGVEFTAKEESEPWPGRAEYESKLGFDLANDREAMWRLEQNPPPSPPPISSPERVPEAPVLIITLEGDGSHMTRNGQFIVTSQVTYKPLGSIKEAKPITFHIYEFDSAYRLYRLREGKWKRCETEDSTMTGFIMVDLPDEKVNVSQNKDFVSLRPGESWITQQTVQKAGWTHIPDDSVVGDTFRYVFKGATLDWWDWGDDEDHAGTEVTLPCFHWASVVEPPDNNGRPKLVVPGSNIVEFSIVDG
ncbi:hypothetical protein N431DRAFT_481211 [Stipitochalara longipes BDJ]|nr:hypothetical protein N431DRAFT_481211 [Stipitochalara longipes BDJ]